MRTTHMARAGLAGVVVTTLGLVLAGATPAGAHGRDTVYVRHDLVSDQPGKADIPDGTLVNAWGMAQGPTTPVWVSDNGTDATTLYRGDGTCHDRPGGEGAAHGVDPR